jgi:integrase
MPQTKKTRMLSGTATYPVQRKGEDGHELRGRRADGTAFREWFRTKKELEDFDRAEYDKKARLKRGLPTPERNVSYEELVEIVLAQQPEQGTQWTREMLSYSRTRFGAEQVRRIRSDEIGRWINSLSGTKSEKPLSGKTKQHVLAAMRAVLERGVVQGFLDVNPARPAAVRTPRAEETDVIPFDSWAEVYAVAEAAGRPYGPMIRFACATGLRPEEYLALTWADVDRQRRECHVRRTVVKGKVKATGKTRNSLRSIVLTDQALAALRELPTPLRPDQLVFPAPKGGHLNLNNLRNRVWRDAVAEAKIDDKALNLSPRPLYQTRHTFATLALAATGDLAWISQQLGHADIQITRKHYARYLPAVHSRNLDTLNQAWGSAASVSETCQAAEGQG